MACQDLMKRWKKTLMRGKLSWEDAPLTWILQYGVVKIVFIDGEIKMDEIKPSCPECKSNSVAWIFWGYPGDMDWYLKAIKDKEIVGGGCCISDDDPKWECNDCYHQWGERDDD